MNMIGGAALILAAGWYSSEIMKMAHEHGGLSALGMVGMFIIVAAFGISFARASKKDMNN